MLHVESATATDQERLNVANKMADKRKTTGRQTQVTQPRPRTSEKPVKSISDMARDEQSVSPDDGKTSSAKTAKSVKNVSTPARDAKAAW